MPREGHSFEDQVRRIVRRGSKSCAYEDSIKEIAAHYDDLVGEGIASGLSDEAAQIEADRRIGSPLTVALQILNSPERAAGGIRLQRLAALGLSGAACYFWALTFCVLRGWQGHPLDIFGYSFFGLFFASGLLFGRGVLQSRKVAWKPLLAIVPSIFVGHVFVQLAFHPLYLVYSNRLGVRLPEQTSLLMASDVALGFSVRFMGVFCILAAIGFLASSLWVQRLSWFRLRSAR